MKFERAQEILATPDMIEVLYQGTPIWIEKLNPGNQSAFISGDSLPGRTKTVPVSQLVEI